MEGLNFDSILGGDEIESLFTSPEESLQEEGNEDVKSSEQEKGKKNTAETVDVDTLFEPAQSESVGRENEIEEHKEKEEPKSDTDTGASPTDFYSSIASACAEEGVFPDLDEETISKVKTAEDFRDLIESQIRAGLDERQKRVDEALNNNVEPSAIRKYESTLNYLNSLTEEAVSEETEQGEQLRKNIIFQDFINRGFSQQKAQKFTERSVESGTDIADAKEALQSNKDFFQGQYDNLLSESKRAAEEAAEERKAQVGKLRDSIMKDKQLFGDIEVDNSMRRKVFDNISKPVYKDSQTGEYYTALQKYEKEHRADFLKYAGLMYTLTNGFKDFDSFTKGKVRKEVKKGLKELERTLNNTKRDSSGSLSLVTNAREDPESFIGKGIRLDF